MNLKTAWLINSNIEVDDLKKTMDDDTGLDFWGILCVSRHNFLQGGLDEFVLNTLSLKGNLININNYTKSNN